MNTLYPIQDNLKSDFDSLKSFINSDNHTVFLSDLIEVKDLKVSLDERLLFIVLQKSKLRVYSIVTKEKVAEIDLKAAITDFCELSNFVFISGKGLHVYQKYQLEKSLLSDLTIKSLAAGAGSLFVLSSESLLKIDPETLSKTTEIAETGRKILVNSKYVVIHAIEAAIKIFSYDLVPLFQVQLSIRYSKIQLLPNNYIIIGGESSQIEIYNCQKGVFVSRYHSMKKITNFCATEDANYMCVYDSDLVFYNILEKIEETRMKLMTNKLSVAGQKMFSVFLSFSASGKYFFIYLSGKVYMLQMFESYNYPTELEYPSKIIGFELIQGVAVRCEDNKLYSDTVQNIQDSFGSITCPAPKGIYTSYFNKVLFNGTSCLDMEHSSKIISIQNISNCVVSIDDSHKYNIKTPLKVYSYSFSTDAEFLGLIDDHLFFKNQDNLEVYYNDTKKSTKSIKGLMLMFCHNLPKYIIFDNWNIKAYETAELESFIEIECDEQFTDPIYFYISEDDLFLYIVTKTCITFWSIYDYKYIGKINVENIDKILVYDRQIFIASDRKLLIYQNPLHPEQEFSLMTDEKYSLRCWFALKELINNPKLTSYPDHLNHCMIMPMCCNILHIFTHQLNSTCIQKALKEGCCFIRTNKRLSPITIAHRQKTFNIINYYLQSFSICLETDKNSLLRTEDDLIYLNGISSPKLIYFYKSILIPPEIKLSKFGIPKIKGQHVLVTNSSCIDEVNFLVPSSANTNDDSVFKNNFSLEFKISAMRLPLNLGSSGSREFLQSLLACKTQEIFVTPIIKSVLNYKWRKIYYWMLAEGILLSILLVLLNFFIIIDRNHDILLAILSLNSIFLVYESLQASIGFLNYFQSFWNKIDSFRILCIFILPIRESLDSYLEKFLLSFIILVTWTRVISCFSIFGPTRYLIYIIKECTKDTIPFLIILFYLTITFALTFYNQKSSNNAFKDFRSTWIHSYLLNFNSFDTGHYDDIQWMIFIIATLVNPLLLMNMIIALLGNTYSRVKEKADIADLRELTEMIVEIESILVCKRKRNTPKYVQICASAEKIEDQEISDLSTAVKEISNKIPDIRDNLQTICRNNETYQSELEGAVKRNLADFIKDIETSQTSLQSDHEYFMNELTQPN